MEVRKWTELATLTAVVSLFYRNYPLYRWTECEEQDLGSIDLHLVQINWLYKMWKMLAGKSVRAIQVMWTMTLLSFILVPLRLYKRAYIVKALGLDDHGFNLAWVFLLLYTVFLTIAGVYEFGQPIKTLEIDSAIKAVYNERIGQTFAVLGMALAKVSLGIFLLRIVVKRWDRISIWIWMVSLFIVSATTAIIFWIQRLPSESIYDPRIPGHIVVPVTPVSVLLGCWCAAVDFYFALLPLIFIWNEDILVGQYESSGIRVQDEVRGERI